MEKPKSMEAKRQALCKAKYELWCYIDDPGITDSQWIPVAQNRTYAEIRTMVKLYRDFHRGGKSAITLAVFNTTRRPVDMRNMNGKVKSK